MCYLVMIGPDIRFALFGPIELYGTGTIGCRYREAIMNNSSLREVLEILYGLKATLHSEANVSAVKELDQAIVIIQSLVDDPAIDDDRKRKLALDALGIALRAIPSVVKLLESYFS